jgi:hypothetical protein
MVGAGKPDTITLHKGLGEWADKSWYLDEADLASAATKTDGSKELPKTWRLGDQPNLKQMHDDARQFRVSDAAVDERLLELVRGDGKLKAGAGPGIRFHMLPAGPGDVTMTGNFISLCWDHLLPRNQDSPRPRQGVSSTTAQERG